MAVKEIIKYLRLDKGIYGDLVTFRKRRFCSYCNRGVPTLVKKLTSNSQTKEAVMAAKTGKTSISVEDLAKAKESPAPEASAIPEKYAFEDLVGIYFEGGRPSTGTMDILKNKGFIWHKPNEAKSVRGHWTGYKANLIGTPFEVK